MKNRKKIDSVRLPTSNEILGRIVWAAGIRAPLADDRTARRLFDAGNLSEARLIKVYDEFARALVDSGIIPDLNTRALGHPSKDDRLISLALLLYAKMWDGIAGKMRSVPTGGIEGRSWTLPYFRLITIDLAIRLVGFLRLAGISHLDSEQPVWVEEAGHGKMLNNLRKRSGLTRDGLVDRLDSVTENTIDSWLAGKTYPKEVDVVALAHILSCGELEGHEHEIIILLRRNYMLFKIGELLVKQLANRKEAADVVTHLLKYTNHALKGLQESSHLLPDMAAKANVGLMTFGCQFPSAEHLIGPWWRQETDPVWRADLDAVQGNWYGRLVYVFKYLRSAPEAAKWAEKHLHVNQEESRLLTEKAVHWAQGTPSIHPGTVKTGFAYRLHGDAKFSASNRMPQAARSAAEGDDDMAVLHLRRAVELQPLNADYRFELGAQLGKMGSVDEGILECNIAAQLKPEWDLPRIEVGILLINYGRYEEGWQHLEEVAKGVAMSPHLAFSLAYARMKCNEYAKALELFDVVLKDLPEHAQVLDCAAHCCFLIGQTDRGIALAKEAHKRGAEDTFQDWHEGKYKKH
jgi:tetratricopeptide (TPR) repeat protein